MVRIERKYRVVYTMVMVMVSLWWGLEKFPGRSSYRLIGVSWWVLLGSGYSCLWGG